MWGKNDKTNKKIGETWAKLFPHGVRQLLHSSDDSEILSSALQTKRVCSLAIDKHSHLDIDERSVEAAAFEPGEKVQQRKLGRFGGDADARKPFHQFSRRILRRVLLQPVAQRHSVVFDCAALFVFPSHQQTKTNKQIAFTFSFLL